MTRQASTALVFSQSPLAGPPHLVFGLSELSGQASSDLIFSRPPVGNPAELLFGDDDQSVPRTDASIAMRAMLPALSATARIALGFVVTARAVLPPLQARVPVRYASDTSRPTVGKVATHWQGANTAQASQLHRWQDAQTSRVLTRPGWQDAASSQSGTTSRWQDATRLSLAKTTYWQDAQGIRQSVDATYQEALRQARSTTTDWQDATSAQQSANVRFQEALRNVRASTRAHWQNATARQRSIRDSAQPSTRIYTHWVAHWQNAMQPGPAQTTPPITGPRCYTPSPALLFATPWPASKALLFYCDRDRPGTGTDPELPLTFYILPARFYMTSHNLVAQRLPDMAPVPLYSATLSADVGSFAWQFSATGPASLMDQLAPLASSNTAIPQQLQITLDGMTWVFVVESLKQTHAFGKRAVSISGRSATALVGVPFRRELAYTNANPADAQQLAALALDLTGVALDWGITDWQVPANAWSAIGTPLSAVQAIAEAAGGYLQSHRSTATLQVRHPYPPRPDGSSGGPWNWSAGNADIELAPDAIITSGIERRDGADINAVYVSGTTQGVLAWVKRTGTAGEKLAPMQTDVLITASQAAQQRGLAVLGKSGPQLAISLELPILTGTNQPGVIDVGRLVQINDPTPWRGRVRSVSVNAALPTARQTITLERHL